MAVPNKPSDRPQPELLAPAGGWYALRAAVAGGADAVLTQGAIRAWESLQALARVDVERPETSCRPFALDRSGFVLGEGAAVLVLTPMLHRDPKVWGPDAEEFNPDHFTPERMAALPPNAYKPFGSGQRACIGRQFAMQEATPLWELNPDAPLKLSRLVMKLISKKPEDRLPTAKAVAELIQQIEREQPTQAMKVPTLPANVPVVRSLIAISDAFPGGPEPAEVVVTGSDLGGRPVAAAVAELHAEVAATHGAIREPISTAMFGNDQVLIVSVPLATPV